MTTFNDYSLDDLRDLIRDDIEADMADNVRGDGDSRHWPSDAWVESFMATELREEIDQMIADELQSLIQESCDNLRCNFADPDHPTEDELIELKLTHDDVPNWAMDKFTEELTNA